MRSFKEWLENANNDRYHHGDITHHDTGTIVRYHVEPHPKGGFKAARATKHPGEDSFEPMDYSHFKDFQQAKNHVISWHDKELSYGNGKDKSTIGSQIEHIHERKKGKKKHGLKYVFNVEGEPAEISEAFDQETARVAHSVINKLDYGLGRPRIQGDCLVYNTPDPEDAVTIAEEILKQFARYGITGTATPQGRDIVVRL